jgi:hypothetical protein
MTEKQIRAGKRQARAKRRTQRRTRKKKDRINSCLGKIKHEDIYGAIGHLKRLNKADLGPYKCRYCRFWHIGHKNLKVQLRIDQLLSR